MYKENVDNWPHLGHIFNAQLTDDDDIIARRNSFIGQANSFFCNFSMLDVQTKNTLFKVYSSSHYGSELWNLTSNKIEDYCIAWRKSLRKLWSLPYDSNRINVALMSNTVPLFDEICRRAINFIYSCLNCDSDFIRSIVLHGVNVARINSPIGRSAAFCSLRYNNCINNLCDTKLSSFVCFARFKSELSPNLLAHANVLREAILIKDGVLSLDSSGNLNIDELNCIIETLAA